ADDLFTANKRRVRALCAEIARRGVRFDWSAFARVNTVDPETLRAMRSAGCDSISFGIESGNPEMLKRVRKGITLDQARQAVSWSKEAGLRVHASFMAGLPGESIETLEQSHRFAEALGIEYGFHFLSPFPGTTVREEIQHYDLEILTDDWRLYDANQAIVRTSRLRPEEMDQFVAAVYQAHKVKTDPMEARYREGHCSTEEYLMFEGYYRMRLIYQLLADDMIDSTCLPAGADGPDATEALVAYIAQSTRMDTPLVDRTIKSLVSQGYLKCQPAPDGLYWFWTYNNHMERPPFSQ
ncbi:MAG: radical SAM protein, partial [Desulfatitalea sp.]|nr:radical SAM protein [Desulfatitalea sp.]